MENSNQKSESKIKKLSKYFAGIFVVLMTIFTAYLLQSDGHLMADLTQVGGVPAGVSQLYIPNYTAGIGESGLIEIKSNAAGMQSFDSITFALHYSPVNSLIFENNPIIFDATTRFQNASFKMTASPEAGKLIVTIILDNPININAGDVLFKLNTKLDSSLPVGQVIDLTVSDLAMLNGSNPITTQAMPASIITVQSKNDLKVFSAESLDSTHVLVEFSDYISDMGVFTDYTFTNGLATVNVESGTAYSYDQKYVVLTTVAQTAGTEYTLTVANAIQSNQQGSVNADFSRVIFYGYGQGSNVLSDFAMESATVSGYNSITVHFSDAVKASSVTKADFSLSVQGGAAVLIDDLASVSGSDVTLLVNNTALLKKNTYIFSAVTPSSILRDSDSAILGVDRVAFAGAKNGPRLISAHVINASGLLQLTFDEDIQLSNVIPPNHPYGHLYTNVAAGAGTLIDDAQLGNYHQAINGKVLTLENPIFNNANAFFAFAVSPSSWITNALGVSVDDNYNTISFSGYGYSASPVGSVQVTKKDSFVIHPGSLDFSTITKARVTVLYDNGLTLISDPVQQVGMSGSDLLVSMSAVLLPDRHYLVRIDDASGNALVIKDFVLTRDLSLSSAEVVSNTQVRLHFSENIDERDVDKTDFSINDGAIAINSMSIDSNHQSVLLTSVGPFTPANVFKASVSKPADLYSYDGHYILQNSTFFTGYGTQSALGSTQLNSIDVIDDQTIRMHFSDDILLSSFTPVNLNIFWIDNAFAHHKLTITAINQIDSKTYELSTSIQDAGKNYFVIFDGVKDTNGLRLANQKVSHFFGFELPHASISLVTPSTITNDIESNVIVSGHHLDIVKELRVGTETMNITNQSESSLTFTVPVDFSADLYNITLIDQADNSLVFNSALLVKLPTQNLVVHSDQSKSIPYNVPNDGETTSKLWLLVEDPVGLSNVSSVVANLSQIGGPSAVEMIKDTGTQPQYSQWYTYDITVPSTIQTKNDPYLLPVEVRKGSETFNGTISIRVTKDVAQSVAPTIDQIYISPISVAPDGKTKVKISAQVSDQDGASTLNSVVADLGALGIGFKQLTAIGEITEGSELETQFYESEEFTIPDTTTQGDYTINVIASDTTGEQTTSTLQLKVSSSINGPKIDADTSYISPRKSIPRDGKTTFDINVYVSDTDGVSDIQNVTASFGSLGLSPISLQKDADVSSEGDSAWYKTTGLTVPNTAPLGIHDIEIIATDSSGGIANLILQIEVTHKDTLGDPPRVVDDRAYITPRIAVNDGKTPITLYVFVQDDDGDVESVVADLSEIGQVGLQNDGVLVSKETQSSEIVSDGCSTGSNVLVCMNPSAKEGARGQWFILPDVTISTLTSASSNPYYVDVIVTDKLGKTSRGKIPVLVSSSSSNSDQQEPPKAVAVVPTSETTVEIVFNKELSANSVQSSAFTISAENDISDELLVVGSTINPSGNVVTLSTANQIAEKPYVLSIHKDIKDLVGRNVIEGAENRFSFSGFTLINKPPIVDYIQADDVDVVEIEFRDPLKPSSVHMGSSQSDASAKYGISIYESEDSSKRLDVLGVELLDSANVLRIKTGRQASEKKYRINITGLKSYDGTALPVSINKGFKGYDLAVVRHKAAANVADLNGDGRVDFSDFTIFSSVYGTIYYGEGENLEESSAKASAQVGQALEENPNATVPITSVPAGGKVE